MKSWLHLLVKLAITFAITLKLALQLPGYLFSSLAETFLEYQETQSKKILNRPSTRNFSGLFFFWTIWSEEDIPSN